MPIQIAGTTMVLRGREVVLPPLTVRILRKFTRDGRLKMVTDIADGTLPTDEQWGAVVDLITEALRVNNPEITTDEVEDIVDLPTLPSILGALFSSSGFKRGLPPGEGPGPSTGTM